MNQSTLAGCTDDAQAKAGDKDEYRKEGELHESPIGHRADRLSMLFTLSHPVSRCAARRGPLLPRT